MAYIVRRVLTAIPVLWIVSIIVFLLIHLIPGNPAQVILGQDATPTAIAALTAQLGLNKPLPIQYIQWLGQVLQGNLGKSLLDGESVNHLIMQRLPVTVELAVCTILVALLIAFPMGILAAVFRGKWLDVTALFSATVGIAVPPFWIGILFLLLFTVRVHWFPSSGYVPIWQNPLQNLQSMVLPAVATGIREAAVLMRMLRGALLDVLDMDFIRTARAKGMSGYGVIIHHALKNALIPVITTGGLQIAGLLGGLVITETIFSLPGFGSLLVQSVFSRDYTTVQGTALIAAVAVVLVNLVVDVLYSVVDPRIQLGGRSA
ncbi:ABC transporter permease [Alicyclobacillus tolerans]|uniref:Peptide/nickel transport system permease protein n=2 Tax=Alicyclobacillus tolerans TaxID=90970 RepID=A0ABT9LYY1_9BACL|nr:MULTISPECIES: ABC transporter permease [Alicyclobacillus]MDP9729478.1 peptide/nickel transport system permease protein [Alicyclobacillus tengchongensis]QRF22396.1 ABC transporter permease [Alicyclobacillus sp. TC]SHK28718.1 peptide/nickel transport system permease protein [Alicyclobacillus montanus]